MEDLLNRKIFDYLMTEKIDTDNYGTYYIAENPNDYDDKKLFFHYSFPDEKEFLEALNSFKDKKTVDQIYRNLATTYVGEIKNLNEYFRTRQLNTVRSYRLAVKHNAETNAYNLFILMEDVLPIKEYIKYNDFTVNDVINLGLDILKSINSFRRDGIENLGLTLDNIFVTPNKEFKLGNLYFPQIVEDESSLKEDLLYLSPEIYENNIVENETQDLYALGIILYELLNFNRKPFLPSFPKTVTEADLTIAADKLRNNMIPTNPQFGSQELDEVIFKAIGPEEYRYQSANQFKVGLQQARRSFDHSELQKKVTTTLLNKDNKQTTKITTVKEPEKKKEETKAAATSTAQTQATNTASSGNSQPTNQNNSSGSGWGCFFIIALLVIIFFIVINLTDNAYYLSLPGSSSKYVISETNLEQAEESEFFCLIPQVQFPDDPYFFDLANENLPNRYSNNQYYIDQLFFKASVA